MKLQIIGHASLLIRNEQDEPVLLTDPWLIGSCYWRSWWIQNYPDEKQLEILRRVKYCYITHEHPDHYHIPSLRKLGNGPHYLAPEVPNCQISTYVHDVMK